jgi:peptidoglycan/LPS O-acetylase OafA/YrhL
MAWVILILVLLAAAFGVLGAVIKAAAFLVLTILLAVAALAAIAWYSFKGQLRRWERDGIGGDTEVRTWPTRRSEPPRDLPSHDDRY